MKPLTPKEIFESELRTVYDASPQAQDGIARLISWGCNSRLPAINDDFIKRLTPEMAERLQAAMMKLATANA